jgi:hypothetical protein
LKTASKLLLVAIAAFSLVSFIFFGIRILNHHTWHPSIVQPMLEAERQGRSHIEIRIDAVQHLISQAQDFREDATRANQIACVVFGVLLLLSGTLLFQNKASKGSNR